MTSRIENGKVALSEEQLKAAHLAEGADVYVDVDEDGRVIIEATRVYESGEEFLASIRERIGE